MKPESTGVTYSGKAYHGIDALGPLVEPFGAEARRGNTVQSFFVTAPKPLPAKARQDLEEKGYVITGSF
jgi:hypothetical protein